MMCDDRREGDALGVDDPIQLGPEAAARAAQGVVGRLALRLSPPAPAAARLARIEVPSIHQRSKSIRPGASSRNRSRSRMRSIVPPLAQRLERS
jgi:hypothetical protein